MIAAATPQSPDDTRGMRRPYPRYRDSGVEWLGGVPEHWDVRPFRYVCRLAYGESLAAEAREDGDVPVFGSNGVVGQHDTPNTRSPVIVVGRKGSHGEVNFSEVEAFAIDTTYFVDERYTTSDVRWLYYVLLRADLSDVSKDSAIPGLSRDDAYAKALPLPPLDEQRAIAAYLDRETERIDALVAKKRLLIERLEEYRTALITRTVTRGLPPEAARTAGLDPSPRLKPSGVEWLGDVPEHWEVKPLRRLASFRGGATPDKSRDEFWDGAVPWVSPKDMKRASIADSEDHVTDAALAASSIALLPIGSVLVVVRGMILAHSFPVAVTAGPVTINQDMKALITTNSLSHMFLYWCLVGRRRVVVSLCDESAHGTRKLETASLATLAVAVPPDREQRAIVAFLNDETARIDGLTRQVETAIERSQEYRTALITAAVTGKIDVRE